MRQQQRQSESTQAEATTFSYLSYDHCQRKTSRLDCTLTQLEPASLNPSHKFAHYHQTNSIEPLGISSEPMVEKPQT